MKNILTTVLAILAISFALPACSKKSDEEKKKDEHTDHKH